MDPQVRAQVRAQADSIKNEGNALFTQNEIMPAIAKYTEAITLCSSIPGYYGNRAAAYAQMGEHTKAVQDCHTAVTIDPSYSKGFARMGHSLMALGQFKEAHSALTKANELDPGQYQQDVGEAAQKWVRYILIVTPCRTSVWFKCIDLVSLDWVACHVVSCGTPLSESC